MAEMPETLQETVERIVEDFLISERGREHRRQRARTFGATTPGNEVGIYQTADYGVAWVNWVAGITGTPRNGTRCVFYNTNGAGAHRLGCYSNGAWHYVALT